jgi:hypothetical protein
MFQQGVRREEHPGCAVATLQAMLIPEALLQRMQFSAFREPLAWAANIEQDFTARVPSITTTQQPQLDVSQPTCVPVNPQSSRRKYASSVRGSTSFS